MSGRGRLQLSISPASTSANVARQSRRLSTNEIAASLERNNIITDSRVFRILSRIYLDGETLKAGEYEIKAGATMREIVELLKSGKSILYSVSVPEGLTVKQVFRRLSDDPVLEGDLPADLPAEGSLMPDTYKFSRGTKRADILQHAGKLAGGAGARQRDEAGHRQRDGGVDVEALRRIAGDEAGLAADLALVERLEAEQGADEGGLAGAVGADHGHDLARADRDVDAGEDRASAAGQHEVPGADQGVGIVLAHGRGMMVGGRVPMVNVGLVRKTAGSVERNSASAFA